MGVVIGVSLVRSGVIQKPAAHMSKVPKATSWTQAVMQEEGNKCILHADTLYRSTFSGLTSKNLSTALTKYVDWSVGAISPIGGGT